MTRPRRYAIRIVLFLMAVTAILALLFQQLSQAFMSSPGLNGLILGVLLLGVAFNIRQVLMLEPEVTWIEHFRTDIAVSGQPLPPRLLAPMAAMIGERRGRLILSTVATRALLDGIASRLDESRDVSRYMIGLLIMLGLLGTFWGLMGTIGSVGDIIGTLTIEGGDLGRALADLKRGLAVPLLGMGTAFSTSLFGLGGSLVLGFVDLQAGQAQNRFFKDLEDWLSGVTRLSTGALAGDGEQAVPAYIHALLEQTAESLDSMQQALVQGEQAREATSAHLMTLASNIGALVDQMRLEQALMQRLVEGQERIAPAITRLADQLVQPYEGVLDEATRSHIRNIEIYMTRLVTDAVAGRDYVVQQVRSELRLLARTLAVRADEIEHGP